MKVFGFAFESLVSWIIGFLLRDENLTVYEFRISYKRVLWIELCMYLVDVKRITICFDLEFFKVVNSKCVSHMSKRCVAYGIVSYVLFLNVLCSSTMKDFGFDKLTF